MDRASEEKRLQLMVSVTLFEIELIGVRALEETYEKLYLGRRRLSSPMDGKMSSKLVNGALAKRVYERIKHHLDEVDTTDYTFLAFVKKEFVGSSPIIKGLIQWHAEMLSPFMMDEQMHRTLIEVWQRIHKQAGGDYDKIILARMSDFIRQYGNLNSRIRLRISDFARQFGIQSDLCRTITKSSLIQRHFDEAVEKAGLKDKLCRRLLGCNHIAVLAEKLYFASLVGDEFGTVFDEIRALGDRLREIQGACDIRERKAIIRMRFELSEITVYIGRILWWYQRKVKSFWYSLSTAESHSSPLKSRYSSQLSSPVLKALKEANLIGGRTDGIVLGGSLAIHFEARRQDSNPPLSFKVPISSGPPALSSPITDADRAIRELLISAYDLFGCRRELPFVHFPDYRVPIQRLLYAIRRRGKTAIGFLEESDSTGAVKNMGFSGAHNPRAIFKVLFELLCSETPFKHIELVHFGKILPARKIPSVQKVIRPDEFGNRFYDNIQPTYNREVRVLKYLLRAYPDLVLDIVGGDHGHTRNHFYVLFGSKAIVILDVHLDARRIWDLLESDPRLPGVCSDNPFTSALLEKGNPNKSTVVPEHFHWIGVDPRAQFYDERIEWLIKHGVRSENIFTLKQAWQILQGRKKTAALWPEWIGLIFFAAAGRVDSLLASLDIDVVRYKEAPGRSAIGQGGIPGWAFEVAAFAAGLNGVKILDLMEAAPILDPSGRTTLLAAQTILANLRGWDKRLELRAKGDLNWTSISEALNAYQPASRGKASSPAVQTFIVNHKGLLAMLQRLGKDYFTASRWDNLCKWSLRATLISAMSIWIFLEVISSKVTLSSVAAWLVAIPSTLVFRVIKASLKVLNWLRKSSMSTATSRTDIVVLFLSDLFFIAPLIISLTLYFVKRNVCCVSLSHYTTIDASSPAGMIERGRPEFFTYEVRKMSLSSISLSAQFNPFDKYRLAFDVKGGTILPNAKPMSGRRQVYQGFSSDQRVWEGCITEQFFTNSVLVMFREVFEILFTLGSESNTKHIYLGYLLEMFLLTAISLRILENGTQPFLLASSIAFLRDRTNFGFKGSLASISSISQPAGLAFLEWYSSSGMRSTKASSIVVNTSKKAGVSKTNNCGTPFLSTIIPAREFLCNLNLVRIVLVQATNFVPGNFLINRPPLFLSLIFLVIDTSVMNSKLYLLECFSYYQIYIIIRLAIQGELFCQFCQKAVLRISTSSPASSPAREIENGRCPHLNLLIESYIENVIELRDGTSSPAEEVLSRRVCKIIITVAEKYLRKSFSDAESAIGEIGRVLNTRNSEKAAAAFFALCFVN